MAAGAGRCDEFAGSISAAAPDRRSRRLRAGRSASGWDGGPVLMPDFSIALQNQPAHFDTPFELQTKGLSIKALMDEQKLRQMQMQAAGLELQQKQRAMDEA